MSEPSVSVEGFSVLRGDYIHVVESYVSEIEDIKNRMREVAHLAQTCGVLRVLVEARHANGSFSENQLVDLAEFGADVVGVLERIAMLRDVDQPDDAWMGVTRVLKAVGFDIRAFSSEEAALAWLTDS
ncbi:STAS/SEC14 domain-containing protein [Maricaulis sp.]|uniref:STAS/SEC14 domain-containing protein n=1 Tax=unclassified Maricaulis TaxID=2632371 RepID=UPI001B1AF4A8|nr:STAS/SEC14 domain-containing protein [Maricaulis sp.]MBO6797995.1 hypothetical protein [Maricaulis sp.]